MRCGIAADVRGRSRRPARRTSTTTTTTTSTYHDHEHDVAPTARHDVIAMIDGRPAPTACGHATPSPCSAALAEVEGAMHRRRPDDVELHEVGALDAIVDIVGACAALESLRHRRVVCSPITVGQGTVRAAHGELPNPAPAVVALLAAAAAPAAASTTHGARHPDRCRADDRARPTAFGPLPAMTVAASGFGAGTADIPGRPNVVQVVIGRRRSAPTGGPGPAGRGCSRPTSTTPPARCIAHTIAALLAAGAQDAWVTPIVMKKGRPAHTVHALRDPAFDRQSPRYWSPRPARSASAPRRSNAGRSARGSDGRGRRPDDPRQARRRPGQGRARRRRGGAGYSVSRCDRLWHAPSKQV